MAINEELNKLIASKGGTEFGANIAESIFNLSVMIEPLNYTITRNQIGTELVNPNYPQSARPVYEYLSDIPIEDIYQAAKHGKPTYATVVLNSGMDDEVITSTIYGLSTSTVEMFGADNVQTGHGIIIQNGILGLQCAIDAEGNETWSNMMA